MTLQNLIDYCQEIGVESPLVGVNVPRPLDNETMKSAIMVRCGLLTPVYGEPDVFREMVRHWFTVKQWTFEHLINIIEAKYSPIENFDRYEDYTDSHDGESTETRSGTGSETHSGTDKTVADGTSSDTHSGTDTHSKTVENTVSAYNANTYQPDNRTTENNSVVHGEAIAITHEDETSITHGHKIDSNTGETATRSDTGDSHHVGHLHGNIGVTTNQQMVEQELALLRHFDIYGFIAEQFENDHMLMIY